MRMTSLYVEQTLDATSMRRTPNKREENFSESGLPNTKDMRGVCDNMALAPNAMSISPAAHNMNDEGYRISPLVSKDKSHKIKAPIIPKENETSLPNSRSMGSGKNHNGIIIAMSISNMFAPYSNL